MYQTRAEEYMHAPICLTYYMLVNKYLTTH